jgi:hypothetical protein
MSLRIRRGTEAQRYTPGAPPTGIVFDPGELAWCLDTKKLYIGDGVTPGGVNVLQEMAGVGVQFNTNTQKLDFFTGTLALTTADIAESLSGGKYFTDERAQDAVGAALIAGNSYNSGITFTYDDANNRITAVATGTQIPNPALPADIGKYLTLDNSGNPIWHNPPIPGGLSIPSFSGNGGKFLTTGGDNLSWDYVSVSSLINGAFHVDLDSAGNLKTSGSIKLPSTADITRETGVGSGVYVSVLGGLSSVSADTSPSLGGNLAAGNHNISNVNTLSATTVSATTVSADQISATTGLGANLPLNEKSISGTGSINITGTITSTKVVAPTIEGGTYGLSVVSNSTTPLSVTGVGTLNQFSGQVFFNINAAKGTIDSPTTTGANDVLGGIVIQGYDGSNYKAGTYIVAGWDSDSVLSDTFPKSTLKISVGSGGTNYSQAIFNSQGLFSVPSLGAGDGTASNPSIKFTTDASQDTGFFHPADGVVCVAINGQENSRFDSGGLRVNGFMKVAQVNGTLPSPPEAGMIVLDGTTFKGYNGSSWVALN